MKRLTVIFMAICMVLFATNQMVFATNAEFDEDNYNLEQEEFIDGLLQDYIKNDKNVCWERKLEIIESNYEEIIKRANTDDKKIMLDTYIEIYKAQREADSIDEFVQKYGTNSYQLAQIKAGIRRTPANYYKNYNRAAAVGYALNNYDDYNPNYPNWSSSGGDCANFASQCLHAGGIPMVGSVGNTYNEDMWYSYGNTTNINNVSSTWILANSFKTYWITKSRYYYKYKSHTDGYRVGKIGDIVQLLDKDGRARHTYIVVGKDSSNSDLIMAAHTGNVNDARLSDKCNNYGGGYIIYEIK